MTRPIVIVGAGGFGRHAHDVVEAMNAVEPTYEMLGFLDDGDPDKQLLDERGSKLLGRVAALEEFPSDVGYLIGIGVGAIRRRIDQWASTIGRSAVTAVHPTVSFGKNVDLGPGTVLCSHTSIGTNIRIGRHTHLNFNCTVGHDATLQDYVTAYPGANIAGSVLLEDGVTVGTGAAIIQGITVGANTSIGAAAGVVRNLPSDVVAVGVPARPREASVGRPRRQAREGVGQSDITEGD